MNASPFTKDATFAPGKIVVNEAWRRSAGFFVAPRGGRLLFLGIRNVAKQENQDRKSTTGVGAPAAPDSAAGAACGKTFLTSHDPRS
jgi:hypothetical protein